MSNNTKGNMAFMFGSIPDIYKQENLFDREYKGMVVDNKDPLKLKRVRCIVEGLYETTPNKYDLLPWCMPTSTSAGARTNSGSFSVPEVGSIVGVYFTTQNLYAPFYKGWPDDQVDSTQQGLFDEDYPNSQGSVDSTGAWTKTNKEKKTFEYNHPSGFFFKIGEDGSVNINFPKNLTVKIAGDMMFDVTGNIGFRSASNFAVLASAIGHKASGSIGSDAGGVHAINGSAVRLNGGVNTGTVDSVMGNMDTKMEDHGSLAEELKALGENLARIGRLAFTGITSWASGLIGTKSTED